MPIRYLVFSGGGARTLAHLGALDVMEKYIKRENLKGIGGTSAGSVIGLFVCLGFTARQIFRVFLDEKYEPKMPEFKFVQLLVGEKLGMNNSDSLREWIESILQFLGLPKTLTFRELYERTKILFVVNALNLNTLKNRYFSYRTEPEMSVSKAIQMSCCVPVIFEAEKFENDYYVDGGTTENFIINLFPQDETLGFLLVENLAPNSRVEIKGKMDILLQLFSILSQMGTEHFQTLKNVIMIEKGNTKIFENNLNIGGKSRLFEKGAKSAIRYLQQL